VLDEAGLHRKRVPFSARVRLLCHRCQKRRGRIYLTILACYCLLVLAGLIAFAVIHPDNPEPRVVISILLNLGLIQAFALFLVWPHEAAHLLAAKLLGLRVFRVCIGTGQLHFTFHCLGVPWEVRGLADRGITIVGMPSLRFFRLRKFFVVLAGPLLHVFLLSLCWWWARGYEFLPDRARMRSWVLWILPLLDFFISNAMLLAVSLLPFKWRYGGTFVRSDGMLLFATPFMSREKIEEEHAASLVLAGAESLGKKEFTEAIRCFERSIKRNPKNITMQMMPGYALLANQQFAEARTRFQSIWDSQDLKGTERAMVADAIATVILYDLPSESRRDAAPESSAEKSERQASSSAAAVEEAERYCAEALQNIALLPAQVRLSMFATKGCLLVEKGDLAQGSEMLEKVKYEGDDSHVNAICNCFLALAAARAGDLGECRRLVAEAERLEPGCQVLQRVRKEWPQV